MMKLKTVRTVCLTLLCLAVAVVPITLLTGVVSRPAGAVIFVVMMVAFIIFRNRFGCCPECGKTVVALLGKYEYCPICGAKWEL